MDVGGLLGQDSTPSALAIVPPKPERKRKKLQLGTKEPGTSDIAKLRQLICDHKKRCQEELKEVYRDNLTELYYLQNGLNFVDIQNLKKRPNIHLKNYLQSYELDDSLDDEPAVKVKVEPAVHASSSSSDIAIGAVSQQRPRSHAEPSAPAVDTEEAPPVESIMEQAKKEASVMQQVAELRKKGLWSAKRLPKVQEPIRTKAHWDYLLEEMQWLAADFAQERKWKKAGCRKISRMVNRYHQDRVDDGKRAEKEEGARLKRIAGQIAKQVKDFWANIEKVVQYKHDSRLDEKRRQAMDMQLNFIVDQTEKYSSWLSAGLGPTAETSGSHVGSSTAVSPRSSVAQDTEFEPTVSSGDDEETIAKEEELSATDQNDTDAEIAALQAEGEMPLDQFLATIPQEILDKPAPYDGASSTDDQQSSDEYEGDSEAADDEVTLDEQEQHETQSYNEELEDLKNEGEMSVEELAAKYAGAYASDFELPDTPSSTEVESDDGDDEDQLTSSDEESAEDEQEETQEVGMEYLLHPEKDESEILSDSERKGSPNREITDIAAAAQSLQPTGYTLETTVVKTSIPFLLKHTLREYQHVGLDWLATMYERKLNGILADEMGLGKTIQTIALLAHLACEHGVWGPHLIVVPTSVMLNWEMELKKWCPGFKILTYYGSQKERKLKRVGWTKTNAFHVCITSYKLVIQDHAAFKRKKWKYLILDEAQNIKNFKSQRWQTLLNFNSQRRLLLTGTPLQNNLMELWSLMHFLMPHVFQSHMDFKEWFANPLTGMIEGTNEYNDQLIRRLHKVLRPFLLRRLKADVERQLPKKFEHVVMCRLSKRQRFLYEEFMSRRSTKDTLAGGNFMSVINILMQLRKVCNHPDLFDPRPIISPFETESISIETASAVLKALEYEPLKHLKLCSLYPNLVDLDMSLSAYAAHRSRKLQTPKKLIEMIDSEPDPPPRPPPTKLRPFVIRSPTPSQTKLAPSQRSSQLAQSRTVSITSSVMKPVAKASVAGQLSNLITQSTQRTPVVAKSVAAITQPSHSATVTTPSAQAITLQIQHSAQGTATLKKVPSTPLSAGLIQLIKTSSGHLVPTPTGSPSIIAVTNPGVAKGQSAAGAISSSFLGNTKMSLAARLTSTTAASPVATVDPVTGKPVLRVPPTTLTTSISKTQPITVSSQSIARTAAVAVVNGTSVSSVAKTRPTAPKIVTASGVKPSSTLIGPASRKRALEVEARNKFVTELSLESLKSRQADWRSLVLGRVAASNRRNCNHRPVYGFDLHDVVDVWTNGLHKNPPSFQSNGAVHCYNASRLSNPNRPKYYWNSTSYLKSAILSASERLLMLRDIMDRFVFVTPTVKSAGFKLHGAAKCPVITYEQLLDHVTTKKVDEFSQLLHPIQTRMLVQFPEKRLIQYDCGKLQTLDILLRDLKANKHRVLIFTQMTRMLDVLEAFLNYHGHRYLRLDGTTRVEMRQFLMDRFNADEKIFVFILSTRSGGIGVNLTGADTVIFYDSDWNPTMDAQAQDRCHRIGQTRDVHIYRLVSEKTVEENILKKANQKRMLGDVAIEGGNFTTASLQQGTITDLFAEPSGLESLAEVKRTRQAAASPSTVPAALPANAVAGNLNEKQFEQALCQAEDAEDVQAAAVASEEAGAELAEFDENIPWDEREAELKRQQAEKTSKVEQEIALLEKELTPVERFAVLFLEQTDDQFSEEAIKEAEMDIEQAKTEWELNRLKNKREEEERRAEMEEDDMLFTYSKEDGMNQAFKDSVTGENMPMWCPPTPPHSENDIYVDHSMCFLYDSAIMTEAQLPPIHVKKEKKRRHDSQPTGVVKKKARVVPEEAPQTQQSLVNRPPRSLFDRPQLLKLRREKTLLRHGMAGQLSMKMGASGNLQRPGSSESSHQDQPEWLIHEDWSLLQAVQTLLQLPLNLIVTSPAHIPNWDLVSDIVSTTSRIYRSAKQCKTRYETVIIPREEGKITFDANPRKPSKKIPKSVYKTKGNKPMRTGQLYTQDSGSSVTTLHAFRFDCIKNVASKRTPTLRPTLVNPTLKNPKHAAVIADSGIQYDSPMNPEEVAKIRQERIKSEKNKADQQRATTAQSNVRAQNTVQLQQFSSSGATTAIISPATKQALQGTAMSAVSIGRNNSIVVSNPLGGLTRKLPGQATSVISGVTQVSQTGGRKMTVQEIQQLRTNSTTVAQFMKQVQAGGGSVTGVSQGGSQRTITVQQGQQPISIGGNKQQFSQLNILSQHQAKQRTTGATLVAQRTASGATQLLSGQQLQQSGDQARVPTLVKTVSSVAGASTTNMTIPVSAGVNINVTLPQQQKTTLGAITKAGLTGSTPHQFRQIQLLHNKPVARPQLQKLSLSPQLVGKTGASVQIVQQKIGTGSKIGMHQIQQLIKQQQAQQAQHAQIITNTGTSSAAATGTGGQTIIATSQLLNPSNIHGSTSNMHATITKMTAPNSSASLTGAVSNVTVSLARPVITSTNPVAIVPGSSLVTHSPSKLVATSTPRPTAHRVPGTIAGIVAKGSAGSSSVVSLASVTVQGLQSQTSATASLVGSRSLPSSADRVISTAVTPSHSQATTAQATIRTPTVVTNPSVSVAGGKTVLHQTILTNKTAGSGSSTGTSAMSVVQALSTSTPSIVAQSSAPTVVVPVDPQLVTLANVGSTVTVATTPAPEPPVSSAGTPISGLARSDSPGPDLSELQTSAPDSTRTYAMRPRKTN